MAKKSVSFKGEVTPVSYQTINEIVRTVSSRYPADAAMAALSDTVAALGYLVQ